MTINEARKLLDDTKVYVYNKSVEIQHKLFNIGYRWKDDKSIEIRHKDAPFLYINKNGLIECGTLMNTFLEENKKEISIDDILSLDFKKEIENFIFNPFDKVLLRDSNNDIWKPGFFYKINDEENALIYKYKTIEGWYYKQCIPYNDKTKHLLGTTDKYQD